MDDNLRKIEQFKHILNNALNMHFDKEILLKISRKLDKTILDYYKKGKASERKKDDEVKKS
ncbi:Spo0E family sporulation regulatory protein-aspartic acid phosphatase [Thermovenabulum gondwanense]|uniref:Spo0E like sporulation regulatory protein n=1 Tax=Thermovenabulum gondwanense TaxID=520767 RepID=A0A161PU15_9FIRM|nr:Spo0E family sporulation regulatory protein-aspartic acid phosphatase [Thermovenabulum gondwanense]KYO65541.1 hypothetical protein ATZ99_15770 [Thermovenabulum gondwanense]